MSAIDVISDYSNKNLEELPEKLLDMFNLKMLYLEGNSIERLPDNFFHKLSRLTWLDLRKNKIKEIPSSIACHSFLETLLLQDNEIEALPNEIGSVPNLKVLQLSGNPLTYPPPEVVNNGILSILEYLKEKYEESQVTDESPIIEDDEDPDISTAEAKSSTQLSKDDDKVCITELLRRSSKKRIKGLIMPVIDVKSLHKVTSNEEVKAKKFNAFTLKQSLPSRKIHRITRSCSKISIGSHYQWNTVKKKPSDELLENNELKELWINKLKDLLADQEKILQQEKNLQMLNKWRLEKKAEAPRTSANIPLEVPYGIDPECNRILSRKDLTKQIDSMIRKQRTHHSKDTSKKVDIQKLINQVVDQMRNMEVQINQANSPRTEQEIAAKQIESIVELHKKIMALQTANASIL